jgi:hypothetical protein
MSVIEHPTGDVFDRYNPVELEDNRQATKRLQDRSKNAHRTPPEKKRISEKSANPCPFYGAEGGT